MTPGQIVATVLLAGPFLAFLGAPACLPRGAVMSTARLCMALAPDEAALTAWGRDHADRIKAPPEPIRLSIRAAYAARLSEIRKGTEQ